jgi:hypothetical protein
MSFSDVFYNIMHSIRPLVQADPAQGKSVLGVGAQDFFISEHLFRKNPIDGIDIAEIRQLYSEHDAAIFSEKSKKLARKLFFSFGYSEYKDLDIYSRADLVLDLNFEIPENLKENFDLVLDVTSNYVSDVRKAYQNTSEMCKIGGLKLVVAMIGDQTNRFDTNPSPNYLLDLHVRTGFVLEWSGMVDNSGKVLPYPRMALKATKLPQIMPMSDYLRTWIRQLAWAILVDRPMAAKAPRVSLVPASANTGSPASPPAPASPAGGKARLAGWLKSRLSPDRLETVRRWRTLRARRRNHWIVRRFGDQWTVAFLLRKVAPTTAGTIEITPHYRAFDETRAQSQAQ